MSTAIKNLSKIAFSAALLATVNACTLMQTPDDDGVDPSQVVVEVAADIKLALPDANGDREDLTPDVSQEFMRRFIIDVVLPDGTLAQRSVEYQQLTPGKNTHNINVKYRLNARKYKILVWSDYVKAESPQDHLHYDISSLTPVLPQGNYAGNNERKDCFRGCVDLDLSPYRDSNSQQIVVDVPLSRPVARYEIVTTDLGAFRQRLASGQISGSDFTIRVRYADYRATGYHVLHDVPKNFLSYLYYTKKLGSDPINTEMASTSIGFDYCLVDPGENGTNIPVEIETINEQNQQVSRTIISIPLKQGYNTVISGRFLTGADNGQVGVDPDYDGEIDVDLGTI